MSSAEWKTIPLSDIVDIIGGGTPKTSNPDYWNGEIPWISIVDFGNGKKFIWDTEKKITQSGLENSSTRILHKGQIVISARGTVGEIGVVTKDMAFNQSCYGLNAKDIACNEFLYYLLSFSIHQLKQKTHGSVFETITRDTFNNIHVNLPPLPEQRAIAGVLSALDDKIELNRHMNHTLEQLAQALFKHMFIDNPESEKWEERPLDEIAIFLNGLAMQKFPPVSSKYLPVIKIAQLRTNNTENSDRASAELDPAYVVNDGDVLFSWSGSLAVVLWCGGKGALNQHLFKVSSGNYPKWFYYYWINYHLPDFQEIAVGKATTMGHIQRHHLTEAIVNVPPKPELDSMTEVMAPLVEKIIANNIESRTLAELRDTLLPKLMSGQVRVTQIPHLLRG